METHAYQEMYVSSIRRKIATAFDCAINEIGINCNDFLKYFSSSRVAKYIENGDIFFVLGKSGIEIALDILSCYKDDIKIKQINNYNRTIDFWIGYAISYYQWHSNRSFKDIFYVLNYHTLEELYYKYHEVDINKFVEEIDVVLNDYYKETNLKRIRNIYGISQKELAIKSNVSLRSIQMYEQKNKDINKANAINLYMLSKALGCQMEDLLEKSD